MTDHLQLLYRFDAVPADAAARALGIALEQSTELPAGAEPASVHQLGLPGRVDALEAVADQPGRWQARIALPVGLVEAGSASLLNVLFGNSSMQADVELVDAELPASLVRSFQGPQMGTTGLRVLLGKKSGPLTCTALKPVGLPVADLASLAGRFARAGIDLIKDDHGIGDQCYAPFADRLAACARAVEEAYGESGGASLYVPHVSGPLELMRVRLDMCVRAGVRCVMVAPMLVGLPAFEAIAAESAARGIAVLAHPALSGAVRIAPSLLLGRLYRLLGADAVIFVNHGGRFGTPPELCRSLAEGLRTPWHDLRSALPVPAGGMTLDRVPEMIEFYGDDVVLLISGALYPSDAGLDERARVFVEAVAQRAGNRPPSAVSSLSGVTS